MIRRRKRRPLSFWRLLLLLALVFLLALGAAWFFLPPYLESLARDALRQAGLRQPDLTLSQVTLNQTRVDGLRGEYPPATLHKVTLEARYRPFTLIEEGRLDALSLTNLNASLDLDALFALTNAPGEEPQKTPPWDGNLPLDLLRQLPVMRFDLPAATLTLLRREQEPITLDASLQADLPASLLLTAESPRANLRALASLDPANPTATVQFTTTNPLPLLDLLTPSDLLPPTYALAPGTAQVALLADFPQDRLGPWSLTADLAGTRLAGPDNLIAALETAALAIRGEGPLTTWEMTLAARLQGLRAHGLILDTSSLSLDAASDGPLAIDFQPTRFRYGEAYRGTLTGQLYSRWDTLQEPHQIQATLRAYVSELSLPGAELLPFRFLARLSENTATVIAPHLELTGDTPLRLDQVNLTAENIIPPPAPDPSPRDQADDHRIAPIATTLSTLLHPPLQAGTLPLDLYATTRGTDLNTLDATLELANRETTLHFSVANQTLDTSGGLFLSASLREGIIEALAALSLQTGNLTALDPAHDSSSDSTNGTLTGSTKSSPTSSTNASTTGSTTPFLRWNDLNMEFSPRPQTLASWQGIFQALDPNPANPIPSRDENSLPLPNPEPLAKALNKLTQDLQSILELFHPESPQANQPTSSPALPALSNVDGSQAEGPALPALSEAEGNNTQGPPASDAEREASPDTRPTNIPIPDLRPLLRFVRHSIDRVALESTRLELPSLDLQGLNLVLESAHGPNHPATPPTTGRTQAPALRGLLAISRTTFEPHLLRNTEATLGLTPALLQLTLNTQYGDERLPLTLRARYVTDEAEPILAAELVTEPAEIINSPLLNLFVPDLPDITLSGNIALTADLVHQGNSTLTSARLTLRNGRFALPDDQLTLDGLDLSLTLDQLLPLASAPAQRLTASTATIGDLLLENLTVEFQLLSLTQIRVDRLEAEWAGGRVTAAPFTYNLDGSPYLLDFTFLGIDLAEVSRLLPDAEFIATGIADGRLPLRIEGTTIRTPPGLFQLRPDTPATLQILQRGWLAQQIDPANVSRGIRGAFSQQTITLGIEEALTNLTLQAFELALFSRLGAPPAILKFEGIGRSETMQAELPINLTVNLNDLPELLDLGILQNFQIRAGR